VGSEIEQHAARVLGEVPTWIWDGRTLPVPVEHIADSCFGLRVRDVDDLRTAPGVPDLPADQVLSGLLLPGVAEIWVNAAEARAWPPRRRFTIGHELGHWVLHQQGETTIFCRHGQIEENDEDRPPLDPIEEEANQFAAALLMPAELVRREYERDRDFDRLCAVFGSSRAAMGRRLHQVI
jgi:hypothetical protein